MNWLNDENQKAYEHLINLQKKDTLDIKDMLFGLYQVEISREIQEQYVFLKHSNLQPSEIKEMQYWEYQMMLDELRDYIEREKEEHDKESGGKDLTKNTAYRQAQKDSRRMGLDPGKAGSGMPKLPNMPSGGFKMPNIKL